MTTTSSSTTTSDEPSKEHEDPSLSSASLCIKFHLLGETFGPVFTHQAFPGEYIRGYHPPMRTLMELTAKKRKEQQQQRKNLDDSTTEQLPPIHSSHVHHETATKELSIDVKLSPSCQICEVNIDTQQKRLPRRQSLRASKRIRRAAVTPPPTNELEEEKEEEESDEEEEEGEEDSETKNDDNNDEDEGEDEEEDSSSASEAEYDNEGEDDENDDDDDDDDDSEYEVDGNVSEVEEENDDKEGYTRKSRQPTKEILNSMKKGLPNIVTTTTTDKRKVDDRYLRKPLGIQLKEYSVNGKDFILCLANGTEAAKFHKDVQRLALWFIETADEVNVASQDGGFWKKPKAGYVVRICQALVLPPYQRSGHGKQMLTCILDLAHGKYAQQLHSAKATTKKQGREEDEIVEINVEWPAPAFILLRNKTDYHCLLQSIEAQDPWYPIDTCTSVASVTHENFFTAPPESEIVNAAAKAKIIPRQIQIVEELYKLQKLYDHLHLQQQQSSSSAAEQQQKEELQKRYRLMVKKRLNKENREHLSGFRTKAEKQAFLEEEFNKCLESYRMTLGLPPQEAEE